jgi:signal transduction histidine kinase
VLRRLLEQTASENRAIVGELHDGLQQSLVSLRLQLSALAQSGEPVSASELHDLVASVDDALAWVRNVCQRVYPTTLRDLGLTGALHSIARSAAITTSVRTTPDPLPRFDPMVEHQVYLIVKEALTNAAKHAAAQQLDVDVHSSESRLVLAISDDGRGIPWEVREGFGLTHIRDRVRSLGGTLHVEDVHAGGTRLLVTIHRREPKVSPNASAPSLPHLAAGSTTPL